MGASAYLVLGWAVPDIECGMIARIMEFHGTITISFMYTQSHIR